MWFVDGGLDTNQLANIMTIIFNVSHEFISTIFDVFAIVDLYSLGMDISSCTHILTTVDRSFEVVVETIFLIVLCLQSIGVFRNHNNYF